MSFFDPPTVGYSTPDYLLLDLDNSSSCKSMLVARMLYGWYPRLGNCLMRRSSGSSMAFRLVHNVKDGVVYMPVKREGWHLIFGGKIGIKKVIKISETLEVLGILNEGSAEIRKRRGDNTLRVTNNKPYYSDNCELSNIAMLVVFCGYAWASEGIEEYLKVARAFMPELEVKRIYIR